jgi:hypothetical protein
MGMWPPPDAALQGAHSVGGKARPEGQLLLRKTGGLPKAPQAGAERRCSALRGFVSRIPFSHHLKDTTPHPPRLLSPTTSEPSVAAPPPHFVIVWGLCRFCAWSAAFSGGTVGAGKHEAGKEVIDGSEGPQRRRPRWAGRSLRIRQQHPAIVPPLRPQTVHPRLWSARASVRTSSGPEDARISEPRRCPRSVAPIAGRRRAPRARLRARPPPGPTHRRWERPAPAIPARCTAACDAPTDPRL